MRHLSDAQCVALNRRGRELERLGRIDDAIALYEHGLAAGIDTPFTFRRLAIIYRRLGRAEDLARVREAAKTEFGHYV